MEPQKGEAGCWGVGEPGFNPRAADSRSLPFHSVSLLRAGTHLCGALRTPGTCWVILAKDLLVTSHLQSGDKS